MKNPIPLRPSALVAGLAALTCATALATEGGGSIYPQGVENYMSGALPPPGTYGMVFGNVYHAGRVNDANGDDLHIPDFKVTANVVAPRFVWVTGAKLFGGDMVIHTILPIVDLKVRAGGCQPAQDRPGRCHRGHRLGLPPE